MKSPTYTNKKAQGFTLVEMIGVLAMVAILTAMIIPKVFETINTTRINAASSAVNTVKNAVATHFSKFGGFADSDGTLFLPATVDASADAANFDTTVLLPDGILDKRFSVKIGDQADTNLVRIRKIDSAADAAAITDTSANYDMDGVDEDVDTNSGALVCECVITGVSAADARALKENVDGSDITTIGNLPELGAAATKGRVKYGEIGPGETGTVLIYINHM